METVTLKLPPTLLRDAARVAQTEDVTVGHLVRLLLAKEVARRLNPKTAMRADEGLLAALQALLARDIAEATGWDDLDQRLARHGYRFQPAGGGIALYKVSCGTRVCKGSELGFGYRNLIAQFSAPMPGHPHGALGMKIKVLQPDAAPLNSTQKGRLQRALTPVFRTAESWEALIEGLARQNYRLRPVGTGIGLFSHPQGRHICNTSSVGYSEQSLTKKFGAEMPDHHARATPPGADDTDPVIEAYP